MKNSSLARSCAWILAIAVLSVPAFAGAVITNGSGIYLGVNNFGELGYTDGVTTTLNGSGGTVGVAVIADLTAYGRGAGLFDATSPGCICEGWGASVNGTIGGGSDIDSGGTFGLTFASFASTASTATTVSTLTGTGLQIQQVYAPSASSALMEDTVTLTNTGADALDDVTYRRVMDWDIPPAEFSERVTIQGWPAADLVQTSDNGFASPNPLSYPGSYGCPMDSNFVNCGPADHGALFDFDFGTLAAGESKTFNIFYGAAFGKSAALAALGTVGAEVYSFGNWGGDADATGYPITYIFGFEGVGGTPLPPPSTVPEPSTYLLVLGGLGLIAYKKRKA